MKSKNIAVVGVGTAGILSLSHILGYMPNDCVITSIFDPNIPILGVGETAGPVVLQSLFKGCGFTFADLHHLDGTFKYGSHFINWREDDVKVNVLPPEVGIHFNNFKLKEYALPRFTEIHGDRFKQLHGSVSNIISYNDHADIVVDNQTYSFDWIIDCRGYPENYSNYTISKVTPVNHCLLNIVKAPGDWQFTKHVATKNGWMFGVPLSTRQGWGYLYNDTITSKDDAIAEINEIFNTENLNLKEFKFCNYYCNAVFEGRVVKNGNRALFFEPLDALASMYYTLINRHMYEVLAFNKPIEIANRELLTLAQDIETYIAFIYHGGSKFDSEFWRHTKKTTTDYINSSERFKTYLEKLKDEYFNGLIGVHHPETWKSFNKLFNYKYINGVV